MRIEITKTVITFDEKQKPTNVEKDIPANQEILYLSVLNDLHEDNLHFSFDDNEKLFKVENLRSLRPHNNIISHNNIKSLFTLMVRRNWI